ncbi:MAG TPA: undecaprenyl-diphosphate phosphatase [Bryobacteraceae bacterium]|jgi:undecaprenyl-diphosphatase
MNDYLLSFILGIVEGLTEFLPISSTAHLRISEAMLGVNLQDGYWKMFSIVIQFGAILCLPIIFRNRIQEFLSSFPKGVRGDRTIFTHPLTLTLLAFAATSVLSLLSLKIIGKHLESLIVMGTAFIVGGIVMWVVDAYFGEQRSGDVETISFGQAIWIGICQTLAPIFPGTSRSMATIAAGEVAGLSRTTSLEFSFLLSIPTMAAASCFDLLRTLHPSHSAEPTVPVVIDGHGWVLLAIGFVVSFFVAWGVVIWFLDWVRTRGFAPFAIYRIILGIGVLIWAVR